MVQWLQLGAFTAKGPVQSLVGELRSHKPHGVAKKKNAEKIFCEKGEDEQRGRGRWRNGYDEENCFSSGNLGTQRPLIKKPNRGASLVAQWLRICLPMQGTRVRALVWEDPTCRGATRPVSHNYLACASGVCALQQERPR